jgi:hypothetical protein
MEHEAQDRRRVRDYSESRSDSGLPEARTQGEPTPGGSPGGSATTSQAAKPMTP